MRSCRAQRRSGPIIGLVCCADGLRRNEPRAQRGVGLSQHRKDPSLRSGIVDAKARAWRLALLCTVGFASAALADIKPIPLSPTAVAAGAQITYDKGIAFVTIGSPNNAARPE